MKLEAPNLSNLNYIEKMWNRYQEDANSVSPDWQDYFEALAQSDSHVDGAGPKMTIGREQLTQDHGPGGKACAGCGRAAAMSMLQYNVSQLVRNYRVRGHLLADNNPLLPPRESMPELEPAYYGMSEFDLDLIFRGGHMGSETPMTLREIIANLKATYTGSIGVQFMHIDSLSEREWLHERMESTQNSITLSREQQVRILERLSDAVLFENFLQKKFVGAKSFSLEGAETLIPLLDMAIEKAANQGMNNVVIGMPHRGRLNVLANIMGKHPRTIFGEFQDEDAEAYIGRGDVKYHKGYHRTWTTEQGKTVNLDLSFNPSHLEFVGPVAQGALKARQVKRGDLESDGGLLILIHGDAAMAGEGIVQETFNLSELDGFKVGGTLHIVVNNQIGFTTLPRESRSTRYASDIAKMLQGPIFHVNGEQPDAVAQSLELCLGFRKEFHRDVVIDMLCYRRRGHNEGDEPRFTQPIMYNRIKSRPTVMASYMKRLVALGELTPEEANHISEKRHKYLEEEYARSTANGEPNGHDNGPRPSLFGRRQGPYVGGLDRENPEVDTALSHGELCALIEPLTHLPEDFTPHKKIAKLLSGRRKSVTESQPLDWGTAEALSFASLAKSGTPLRICGQDSQRGTFSHRHSVVHDLETAAEHMPMRHLAADQARVDIINSPLTEGAVLGFEYGYSTVYPEALVVWEAQFGDFANAAQVYIDQFISSGEAKWNLLSGLVLFLPHGLEGTGPEHASARLERYLSLAATDNYQVVYPTTPAQIFHLLRRQAMRTIRKPLVVMSPKSMLRNPVAVSPMEAFTNGHYQKFIIDEEENPQEIEDVFLCTGKIYYDLVAEKKKRNARHVTIVRLEQLYPLLPSELVAAVDKVFPASKNLVWVQEEPFNMGAYPFIRGRFTKYLKQRWEFRRVGRPESATPATGSFASHKLEHELLMNAAFQTEHKGEKE